MNFDVFTLDLKTALKGVDIKNLYEIRLRVGFPVIVKFATEYKYLGQNGAVTDSDKGIVVTNNHINEIIDNITERSLYAYNESLRQGYLTSKSGLRVGVAGDCVIDNGQVLTIKNITSLNVRIPHKVKDCSKKIIDYIINDSKIFNTLIISAPGYGKTTMLKDLAEKISEKNIGSVLIVDEREEFLDVYGENIDHIKNCDKSFAFDNGIRVMSPKVIVTDELCSKNDWECVKNAINCGVNVLASCHADSIEQMQNKSAFQKGIFERFVLLFGSGQAGVVKGVYDEEFNLL